MALDDFISFKAKFEDLLDRACSDLKADDFRFLKERLIEMIESYE